MQPTGGIDDIRREYARATLAKAGVDDPRLEEAFATTPRERYAGPGPWLLAGGGGADYERTPDANPARLYNDRLIALDAERGINNGQPSLHALCLHALSPQPGEHAVHVGAGGGYYTALLARLVGPTGHVDALEIEPKLADQAQQNLADMPWVVVQARSGTEGVLPPTDIIYVNAAASRPMANWLDALRPGGRLLFPLAPARGTGGMLLVRHEATGFAAHFLPWPVGFIGCIGAQDETTARHLQAAFAHGGTQAVQSLRIETPPDDTCWFAGDGWWLSTAAL